MATSGIITKAEDLPDLSKIPAIVIDTETSGLHPHHGDRICGIALGPLEEDWEIYVPIRHRAMPDSILPAQGLEGSLFSIPTCDGAPGLSSPPDPPPLNATPEVLNEWFADKDVAVAKNLPPKIVFDWLRVYFNDPKRVWIFQNAPFDLGMFRADGLELRGRIFDTLSGSHVLAGHLNSYKLEDLTKKFLNWPKHGESNRLEQWFREHQPKRDTWVGKEQRNYSLAPVALMGLYGCEDIRATRGLALHIMNHEFDATPCLNQHNPSFAETELLIHEMQLTRVLFEMNWAGMRLDIPRVVEYREQILKEAEGLEEKMFTLAGWEFNTGSWKQMMEALEKASGDVLFWMLPELIDGKKVPGKTRGKQKLQQFTIHKDESTGRPCWNSAALLKYLQVFKSAKNQKAYDFIMAYRELRQRQYVVGTCLDAYLRLSDPNGIVHASLLPQGTRTGRVSCVSPNLENVSTTKGNADQKALETFLDEKDEEAWGRRIRSLFIARPGSQLVSIDYSQIEYRVAAYFAADDVMLKLYMDDPNTDYHQATVDIVGIDRDLSKTVNFGTLYGMGATGLAATLTGMGRYTTKDGAQQILSKLFAARPSLDRLIRDARETALRNGMMINPYGRHCLVPKDKSYVGLNYWVQGTCGDMMRRAMVRVARLISKNNWPVLMLMNVHDELLFDIPIPLIAEVAPQIAETMCDVPEIKIPIICDIEVGPTWGNQVPLVDWVKQQENPEKRFA